MFSVDCCVFRAEGVGFRFSFVSYGTLGALEALEAGSDDATYRE